MNVFITDNSVTKYDRGLLPSSNRLDIFKYSLASLSVIRWTKVIIYCELDTTYQDRRSEIDGYIKSLFCEPIIYSFRNEWQPQWQAAMKEVFEMDDDFVLFCCNDDHIFVDYESDLLERIENKLIDLSKNHKYVSCYFTHWPEVLRSEMGVVTLADKVIEYGDCFVKFWRNYDSMQIVNKNLLHYWWFEHDYGNTWMPRTDVPRALGGAHTTTPITACIIPYRELARHFDGYSHADIDINVCPPLFIPDGFFENDIKILYCSDIKKTGFVNVNPLKKNYSTVDPNGADLKCLLEDLPLFWRDRISSIETVKHESKEKLLSARNRAVLDMSRQKTLLPVIMLKCALRFDDNQIPSIEMQKLEICKIKKLSKNIYFAYYNNKFIKKIKFYFRLLNNFYKYICYKK